MPMPAWWKKSSKSKEENGPDSPVIPKKKTPTRGDRPHRSFDDVGFLRNTASGSSGFSGFDSDSGEKRGVPLPQPSVSDLGPAAVGLALGTTGSASDSVSSVSSFGSYGEDHTVDHPASQFVANKVHGELKFSTGSRIPGPGSRSPGPGSRSPVPGSRAPSRPTSPLHPRMAAVGLEPLIGRLEECKNQCHPLPLPPGSPSSPSQPSTRTDGVTESPPATPSSWKKGKLLGRGTFGNVYLGFNSLSGQMCAIKEVRRLSEDQTSKECLKQLNQEINLLSRLSHPNIVRYYGSELGDETLSVYLEYVSGGSIHKLLHEYGAFKEPVIQNYTRQILAGLAYLHGRNNCVHRDIKGANILVDPNGEIKLADFGMAKHITAFSSMLSFKGSPYWMAPEVVMNTNGYNLAVDIWSLGCTILEMATSKPPWSQYEGVAAIFKIGNSRDMPYTPDHLSNNAKSFIKLCLQRDPSLRPTAMQLLDHPFVRDQPAVKIPGISMPGDASPCMFDGSRSLTPLERRSSGPTCSTAGGEIAIKHMVTGARAVKGQRDDIRKIASLHVSPSSSPLRKYGPAHQSCLLSPPHPSYAIMAQTGYHLSDYSSHPLRSSLTYPLDPYYETTTLRAQTPVGHRE